ncbi:MAG TPA: hypothetical protein VN851_18560 [Thermoanaerobaculia bacterium]|nr:hypothetical protein [Thermoanaerobaculia bacterium]
MDLAPSSDSITISLREVLRPLLLTAFLAIPPGWIFALIALWRPLPHLFAILSRWFVGVHAAISAVMLLVVGFSLGDSCEVDGMMLGALAASASGLLAWIVVGRRSRALEPIPSLL